MTSYLVTIATDYQETSSKDFKKKKTASRLGKSLKERHLVSKRLEN